MQTRRPIRAGADAEVADQRSDATRPPAAGVPLENNEEDNTMSTNEITAKIRELRELQALIEEATQEAEDIRNEIKAHMGDSEELRAGEYHITWKAVKSARIDTTALRKILPDVAEAFTRETTTRRFCVA